MRRSITIAGRVYTIGDVLRSNARAAKLGLCPENVPVVVKAITDSGLVGLHSRKAYADWGDLEGTVPPHTGYWAAPDAVVDMFDKVDNSFMIRGSAKFKKKSLSGMKCRVIAPLDGNLCFVELEENVGGGSADGLGKKGHCVLVSKDALAKASPPKAKTKKK